MKEDKDKGGRISSLQQIAEGYSSVEFRVNQIVEGFLLGLHKSPFHGFSVEFDSFRQYNSGESTRYIDWKLFARTDRLYVRNYEQETNLLSHILIDTSLSMSFPFDRKADFFSQNKLTFSTYAAGALCSMLYKQRDAFSIAQLSSTIENITECKTNIAHKKHVFTVLEQLLRRPQQSFTPSTSLSPLLHQLSEQFHRSSLVIIFTDLMGGDSLEELTDALEHLRHCKHEVILFHVYDALLEKDLKYKNRPYLFIDAESGEKVKVNPSFLRDEYSSTTENLFSRMHTLCNNMQIDYVPCDINQGFSQVLMPYLLKRRRLH